MSEVMDSDLFAIQAAVSRRFGLAPDRKRLAEAVSNEMAMGGWKHVAAYRAHLESARGRREFEALAIRFCVGETYFFRNRAHFEALTRLVLPRLIEQNTHRRQLRVLSAGCSTGEEAYSIAMTLLEVLRGQDAWDLRIVGIDICQDVIDKARAGSYRPWALRETADYVRDRHFEARGDEYVLDAQIRDMVAFERRNLLDDDPGFWQQECFDLVFCRNTLMYFSQPALETMIARFERVLRPGGYLFLGHAESVRGLPTGLSVRHEESTFFYQRGGDAEGDVAVETSRSVPAEVPGEEVFRAPSAQEAHWSELIEQSAARVVRLSESIAERGQVAVGGNAAQGLSSRPRPAGPAAAPAKTLDRVRELMSQERFHEALIVVEQFSESHEPVTLLLKASLLTNMGDFEQAQALCARLLEADDCRAGAFYLLGLCREQAREWDEARDYYQKAIAADPTFAMPHLYLGLFARRSGQADEAREALGQALELLEQENAERILLFGGGFGREALLSLCKSEYRACGGWS